MNKTRNTLDPAARRQSLTFLNSTVADLFDLFGRVKQVHWNVRGTTFIGLHKLLDEFAGRALAHMDAAAERATALGGVVAGNLRENARRSPLKPKEEPTALTGIKESLEELAELHAASGKVITRYIRETGQAGDFGTADLLTGILRDLDLQLWLIEAHLNQTATAR